MSTGLILITGSIIGAMTALALMHIMSAFFGYAITIIPRVFTYYLSSFLFAVFGIKMLRDGWKMSPSEAQEEFDEVQEELRKKDAETDSTASELETGQATQIGGNSNLLYTMLSRIFIQVESVIRMSPEKMTVGL